MVPSHEVETGSVVVYTTVWPQNRHDESQSEQGRGDALNDSD